MLNIITIIENAIPAIIIALVIFYWQRKQNKRDKEVNARAEARKQESLLGLSMQMANLELSLNTAIALKQKPELGINGGLENGINACNTAKGRYDEFIREQVKNQLH